jgi:hypothetical protein
MLDLVHAIAEPGFAPKEWQSGAPRDVWGSRPPVGRSEDLDRVMALPRRVQEMDGTDRANAIIEMVTERYSLGVAPGACRCATIDPDRHRDEGCISKMRLIQALALREIGIAGGLLGPIGVGHGKTLLDLLAAFALEPYKPADASRLLVALLVPPRLIKQLVSDYDYIGQHFRMPTLIVQGHSDMNRSGTSHTGPIVQVMPYSLLQRSSAAAWFKNVQPHAVIADECHKLRDRNTATTARVLNYFDQHQHARFCGWSGSITSKSIKDYAHLAALALKRGSPLPISYDVVEDWARAIDASPNPADPGALLDALITSGCCHPGDNVRTGLRRRITETVGVVSTVAPAIDCDLEILEREAPEVPDDIDDAISEALAFRRPDGEELVTAMQAMECAITIACGFHYKWIYPHNVFPRDTMLVLDWIERRREWHKELRRKLQARDEYLDSPQLCEHAAERHYNLRPQHRGLPTWASLTYMAWHEIKNKVRPASVPVRMNDYLVQDAAKWMHEHRGIVWYQHTAFGEWLQEVSGLPMFGGGKEASVGILKEHGDRSIIASIKAHGTGVNGLQFRFHEQLYGTPPAASDAWEQSLGRLHRAGQKADVVRAWFYMHTKELRKHVGQALRASLYVGQTMGGEQKLRSGIDLSVYENFEDDEE